MTDPMYEAWPDLITPANIERLFLMFPASKLLHLQRLTRGSSERTAAWVDLGITSPMQQLQCEDALEAFIAKLTKDHTHA
jgi:hypothetical protein